MAKAKWLSPSAVCQSDTEEGMSQLDSGLSLMSIPSRSTTSGTGGR